MNSQESSYLLAANSSTTINIHCYTDRKDHEMTSPSEQSQGWCCLGNRCRLLQQGANLCGIVLDVSVVAMIILKTNMWGPIAGASGSLLMHGCSIFSSYFARPQQNSNLIASSTEQQKQIETLTESLDQTSKQLKQMLSIALIVQQTLEQLDPLSSEFCPEIVRKRKGRLDPSCMQIVPRFEIDLESQNSPAQFESISMTREHSKERLERIFQTLQSLSCTLIEQEDRLAQTDLEITQLREDAAGMKKKYAEVCAQFQKTEDTFKIALQILSYPKIQSALQSCGVDLSLLQVSDRKKT